MPEVMLVPAVIFGLLAFAVAWGTTIQILSDWFDARKKCPNCGRRLDYLAKWGWQKPARNGRGWRICYGDGSYPRCYDERPLMVKLEW